MRISAIAIATALMLSSPLAMAQTDKPAGSARDPCCACRIDSGHAGRHGNEVGDLDAGLLCQIPGGEGRRQVERQEVERYRRDVCGAHEITAVFPTVIAPKYAGEKDLDKALTKTCADQFTANKATNANGGLKWVEKDGGYYAECISRLKDD